MKNGSKRVISRVVAFVMLVSCMLSNILTTSAKVSDIINDAVVSGSAVDTQYKWSADELAAGTLSADPSLGGEIFAYSVVAGKSAVDTNSKTFEDGSDFAQRLKMGGKGDLDAGTGVFTITAPSAGKLYVYAITGKNAEARDIEVYDSANTSIDKDASGPYTTLPEKLPVYVYDITAAGTYKVTSTVGSCNFYGMAFKAEEVEATTVAPTTEVTTVVETSSQTTTEFVPAGPAESFEFWLDDKAVDGVVAAGDYTFGGSIVRLVPGHNGENYTVEDTAKFANLVRAGKTVNAYRAGKRPTDANNVDTIPATGSSVVFTPAADGAFTFYCYAGNIVRVTDFVGDVKTNQFDSPAGCEQFSFKAEGGHKYVINTTGKTNNCAYAGFKYIVDEPITVVVNPWTVGDKVDDTNVVVTLTDADLGTLGGTIDKSTTSITLSKGHTYTLTSNDGGVKALNNGEQTITIADETPITLTLENIPDVTLSGKFIGDASSVTAIKFVNMTTGVEFEGKVSGDGYTAILKPGEYNTFITSDKFYTSDRVSVVAGVDNTNDVYLESLIKDKYVIPEEVSRANTALTLNNISANNSTSVKGTPGSSIVVPVSGVKKVTVAGWYSGTWNINGENEVTADGSSSASKPVTNSYVTNGTDTSVTINVGGTGTAYLYWITVSDVVEYKSEISVPGDYATMKDAVNAIKAMDRPNGERVTINLTADIFEQVIIDAPDVTLKGNGHEISWYYGINYKYYSVDANGVYNDVLFYDKYSKNETNGSYWGFATLIRGENFKAEDVTFKNSFNYNMTDKEIEDGVEAIGGMPDRTADSDVTAYKFKERSSALYIEADNMEFKNCNILSSQDTLGRNGSANNNYHAYFKNCVIGGNVDYICGEFTAVFDDCELQFKTYEANSDNHSKIGYIVAPKTSPYIFRNCKITLDKPEGGVEGFYGRTWGASSQSYFINCESNGFIKTAGWDEMGSGELASAKFFEYGNTSQGGDFASTVGVQVTDEAVIADMTSDSIVDTYFAGWVPTYYENYVAPAARVWGDVNSDGAVDVTDVNLTLEYTLNHKVAYFMAGLADVSGNGTVDSEDVALILQKVLDSTFKFPVEEAGLNPGETTTETTTEATTEETTEATTTTPAPTEPVNVFVVGDSTGCDYADTEDTSYFYKRVGFGTMLKDYFADSATIVNLALSGRSSKSFATGINENGAVDAIAQENYAKLKSDIKAGDYLIIAFGHNDEKTDAYRGTTPATTPGDYTEKDSFEKSLYDNYIKVALDAGATPILCTSTVRRQETVNTTTKEIVWSNNDLHITAAGDYPAAVKALAEKLGLEVIDNLTNTKSLYETLTPGTKATSKEVGATGAAALHAAGVEMAVDNTHLNKYGASYVASMMARDIKANAKLADLAAYVTSTEAPKADDAHAMSLNANWAPFDETVYVPSSLWHTSGEWDGAVFGQGTGADTLTEDSHPNHQINEVTPGKEVNLVATNNKGKIQSSSDGLVMYFKEIPADKDFTITATAVLNNYAADSQTGFGLICRDNVFTGSAFATATDWAGVGCFPQKMNDVNTALTALSRKAGTLDRNTVVATTAPKTGDTIELKMSRTGGVYTVQYGTDAEQTITGVDTNLSNKTSDFVGVMVTRAADVTFKNIDLQVK